MGIGNIGWTEFIVILAIALIFFGPRRLPGIAQAIGRSLREFQKALNEVKSEIAQAGREADVRTGAPYKPRDPLNLLPKPGDTAHTAPGSPAAKPAAHAGPDPDPTQAASGLAQETEVTKTPRGPNRDAPASAPPASAAGHAEKEDTRDGDDGNAGDTDQR